MSSRVSTTPELGRKYDIDYMSWETGIEGEGGFTFGTMSKKTTGLLKSSNKFLKIFLTRKGSDPFDLNLGTYLEDIFFMGASSTMDLQTFVAIQINDAVTQLRDIQANNSFPADENIIKANLTSISRPSTDKIIISIKILTEAGESATVQVPLLGG